MIPSRSLFCLVLALLPTLPARAAPAPLRPNFLVILTDDVGWGDYQCYNPQGKIATPNVDRLAREGMRFTHAHTPAALCAPTRYSMLTGNYPWRGRAAAGTWGFNVPSAILPGQRTVANLLQQAGYRTAMLGKVGIGGQHAMKGGQPDFDRPMIDGPVRWGFDYSFVIPRGHQNLPHFFLENERPVCGAEKLVRGTGPANYAEPGWDNRAVGGRLLDHAEKFLDDVSDRDKARGANTPFFIYLCTAGAHEPYEPADDIRGAALKGQTRMTGRADMVLETDILLGKLVDALARRGLLDNTLICFTSDNGGIPTERHLGHDSVGGLRGLKSYITEGGHRVPFIVRWAGKIPEGTTRGQVVGTHDIVPTVLELAGVAIPPEQCLDAVSLAPVLLGRSDDSQPVRQALLVQSTDGGGAFDDGGNKGGPLTGNETARNENEIFVASRRKNFPNQSGSGGMAHAVYCGDWKLTLGIDDEPAALYNLAADLAEQHNLLAVPAHAERVTEMTLLYRQMRKSQRSVPMPSLP